MVPPPPNSLAFAPITNMSSGGTMPSSIAVGDFNNDGKLDIVVSNFSSNTIAVFLNNGDGTFGAPIVSQVQITALGLGPLAVGDFNEDGKLDVVVATIAGEQADIVLLGNGDGTFHQLPPIPNSFGFFHARVADLNGDGHLDFVTGDNGNISVFLGNGDGTFNFSGPLPQASFPGTYLGIVLGDFNGDKKLDIVACDLGAQPSPEGTLVFYAGNGDGTFQSPTAFPFPPSSPSALASADFNGDGKLDIMIGYPGMAAIALGNGDGTFQVGTLLPVYEATSFVLNAGMVLATGDFDLDGKPDALVGDFHLGIVTLVLNDGIGKIPPPAGTQYQFTLEPGIQDMAVGDLNGDGLPDMVITNGIANQITVILSRRQ
jgi:VCBS repeat protein/FG-GAP repeat protein